MEQVRLCPVCGHINPSNDAIRCLSCWSFLAGSAVVPRSEAEQRSRRFQLPLWRKLHLFLASALALGFVLWQGWTLFDVGPLILPPSSATTSVNAVIGPDIWAQARRSPLSTGYTPDQAPVPRVLEWTFASSRPLTSSPAVVGQRVYLSTEDKRIIALDRDTGTVVWEFDTEFPSGSTPAVTDDLVISATRPGKVIALDRATGAVRWERDIGEPVLSSPVVADGSVYIGAADSNLHVLDVATGRQRWTFATEAWVNAPVSYAGDVLALASQNTHVQIVGTRTARRQLLYDTGRGHRVGGGPVIQGDLVYFSTQDGSVWAIDRMARTYPFERTFLYWKLTLYIWGLGPPPVQKGSVWSTSVGGELMKSPAVSPDLIIAASKQGKITALDPLTGEERWSTEVDAEISSAPIVAGGTVLVGARDGRVLGLDREGGAMLWEFNTGGMVTASPVVAGDTMYVASHDGKLYAVTGPSYRLGR